MNIHNVTTLQGVKSLKLPNNNYDFFNYKELFLLENITDLNFSSIQDIQAAFKGGINNLFIKVDSDSLSDSLLDSNRENIFLYANLFDKNNKLNNLKTLSTKAKAFINNPYVFINPSEYLNAFYYARTFDIPVVIYANDYYLSKNTDMNESYLSNSLGLKGDLEISENIAVYKYLSLAKMSDVKIHFTNITSSKSVELIEQFKKDNTRIVRASCDVSLMHLLSVDEDVGNFNVNFKIYPPLRSRENQIELVEQLKEGKIDAISSSHTPVILDDKLKPFEFAKPGVSIADIFLPLCLSFAEKNNVSLETLQKVLSFGVKLFNLDTNNIVLYGKKEQKVKDNWLSFGQNCPWFNDIIDYQVYLNFCGNQIMYIS